MIENSRKANFFLIGAPKAGTTSIDRLLRKHPQVYLSPIKEPCHFCSDINDQIRAESGRQASINLATYLDAGCPKIVHQHLVERPEDYAKLFSEAQESDTLIGECSTYYLSSKVAPKALYAYNPDAKIVAIIRDPISRIHSHYNMDLRTGLKSGDLASHVRQEILLGPLANYSSCRNYLDACRYTEQIERWKTTFGVNRVLVLIFEELIRDPDVVLDQLYNFLGLDPKNAIKELSVENSGGVQSRFGWVDRNLYNLGLKPLLQRAVKLMLTEAGRETFKRLYFKNVDTSTGSEDTTWQLFREVAKLQAEFSTLVEKYSLSSNGHDV